MHAQYFREKNISRIANAVQVITSARSTVIAAEVVVSVTNICCFLNLINFRSAVYQLLQTEQAEQTRT